MTIRGVFGLCGATCADAAPASMHAVSNAPIERNMETLRRLLTISTDRKANRLVKSRRADAGTACRRRGSSGYGLFFVKCETAW
jgi:hypothetical protein